MNRTIWDWKDGVLHAEGPPVTPEIQRLFGQFAPGQVTGVVTLPTSIVVRYASGIQLTFSAGHSGGIPSA